MAEDIPEESLARLRGLDAVAVASSDVKRGEVFCSKIIHQKATNQSRFTKSKTHMKISAANGAEAGTRPLSSPFPCWQCHRSFTAPPIFIPMVVLNGTRTEWGNFCAPACANRYLHTNMNDSNLAARVADLYEYCQDVHGLRDSTIGMAPHFSELQRYGGDMTDEQFDRVCGTPGLQTHARMAPFIPTEVVVEWQCHKVLEGTPESAPGHAGGSAADMLADIMGTRPEAVNHNQWEVRGLRQKPLDVTQARLTALQKPEQKQGLYDLYCLRKEKEREEGEEAAEEPGDALMVPAAAPKRKARGGTKRLASALGTGLGCLLVPAKISK